MARDEPGPAHRKGAKGGRLRGTEGEGETGCGQSLGGFWRDSESGLLTLREVGEGTCFERDSGTFLWFITTS